MLDFGFLSPASGSCVLAAALAWWQLDAKAAAVVTMLMLALSTIAYRRLRFARSWIASSVMWWCIGTVAIALRGNHRLPPTSTNSMVTVRGEVTEINRVIGADGVRVTQALVLLADDDGDTVAVRTSVPLWPGDSIEATGRLVALRGLSNPGSPDAMLPSLHRDFARSMVAGDVVVTNSRWTISRAVAQWHDAWRERLDATVPPGPGRAVTAGVVLGDRWQFDEAMNQRWRDAGVYHALSVSGLHLVVVAVGVMLLFRRLLSLLPLSQRFDVFRFAVVPSLATALAYTLLTGAQIATWRAMLAMTYIFAGRAAHVRVDRRRIWGVVAIVMLLWRPGEIFDPSFQLSFVAAYVLISMPRSVVEQRCSLRHRVKTWLLGTCHASLWVALVTAPVTAYHFGQVAIAGVLANIVVLPMLELLVIPVALFSLLVSSAWLLRGSAIVAGWADDITGWIASRAPVAHVALSSGWRAVALTVLLGWLASRRRRQRLDVVVIVGVAILCGSSPSRHSGHTLRVTFVDVGQGDAAVVETPDDHVFLIDAGGFPNRRGAAKYASGTSVVGVLRAHGIRHIDDVWISHPHPDHYLGLVDIARQLSIERLWLPVGFDDRASEFGEIVQLLRNNGTLVRRPPLGLVAAGAGFSMSLLAPAYDRGDGSSPLAAIDPVRSVNDNSAVLLLAFGGRRLLFTGDAELEQETALSTIIPTVDVVKVAHHGSRTSSSDVIIEASKATIAVISCGAGNSFGFPHDEVLQRWSSSGAQIFRTDRDGAVTLEIDSDGAMTIERQITSRAWRP
jgi:competence protein ComEC